MILTCWNLQNPSESNLKADNLLDKHVIEMLGKERLLEILHDFVVYDRGQKKFCRPNQYFG
jgi:type I restriction enzyme, R subunit